MTTGIPSEPVRGQPPPRSLFRLPGIEQMRAYERGRVPFPPNWHLTGTSVSQVGSGSAVMTMPASPWLQHPNGEITVALLASTAMNAAGITSAPPLTSVVPRNHSYAQLRACRPDAGHLVARADVVHEGPRITFVRATVEDGRGRLISHSTAHLLQRRLDVPEGPPPQLEPFEAPRYPSPDPHARPLPPESERTFDAVLGVGGLETIERIVSGELPTAPMQLLAGITVTDAAPGSDAVTMEATPWHLGIYDWTILSGWIDTLVVEAAGGATYTFLGPATLPVIISADITYFADVPPDGRTLTATAYVEKMGNDLFAIRVDVVDDRGDQVARANQVAAAIPSPPSRRRTVRRILATVLFTDIVSSTEQAEERGDAKWSEILSEHHVLVRDALDRHGGREIKSTGDGFLATFDSPSDAVECAREIRDTVTRLGIEVRAGIHTGECELSGGDVAGIAVHTAARVEAAARPGEVWVSETTRSLTAGSGIPFVDEGLHPLKGLEGEMRLFSLGSPAATV